MTPAVLYARFSPRPNAEECDSVEKQLERCRAFAQGHGWTVSGEHHDKDLSGGRADNRPGLQAALAQAGSEKAVLVVHSLSRLARCTRDAIAITERLEKAGADLAIIEMGLNTKTPYGRAMFQICATFAELERTLIAARTSSAMRRHQANGQRMTRADRVPFGWMLDPEDPAHLVEDRWEQADIGEIRRLAATMTTPAIARHLNGLGRRCRGKAWASIMVRRILARAAALSPPSQP